MKKILVDIGSDTVNVYQRENEKVKLVLTREIDFAGSFNAISGFHLNEEEALIRLMERISANYFDHKIEAFVRGVFKRLPKHYFDELNREVVRRSRIPLSIAEEE